MRTDVSNRAALSSGFTLIEVLVALSILAVGMLANLSLAIEGLRASRHALNETAAAMLVADLGDRVRVNRIAAPAYGLDEDTVLTAPPKTCITVGDCSSSDVAGLDLYEWQRDVYESLPDALTSVQIVPTGTSPAHLVTITIRWTQTGAAAKAEFALTVQA